MRPDLTFFSTSEPKTIDWASPKQEEAFRYGPAPLCCSGGFGAAKTYALCLKALYLSDLYPKNRGVIARKVAKELALTTQATFFKLCPPQAYDPAFGGRRADSENYLRLAHSGSEILWLHLEDQDIDKVIRGIEINWFILDQAEEIGEDIFDTLLTRLGRWDQAKVPTELLVKHEETGWPWRNPVTGVPTPPSYAMIACNPDAETHWIYKRFHPESRDWQEYYSKLGYRMISMPSWENKFLPKQNLEEMQRKDPSWRRRFLDAEWGIPEGQIHDVKPESIIPGTRAIVDYLKVRCRLHRTLDHGDASPTCCAWWGVDRDGNLFAFREYYKANTLVSEHRRNIRELSGDEKYILNLADPSMFFKTMQKYGGRWSFADDYSDRNPKHGFDPLNALDWQEADNDEMGTRNLINEYLRLQGSGEIHRGQEPRQVGNIFVQPGQEIPRIHPITGEYGYWPRLFFIQKSDEWPNGCDQIIRQMRSQRRLRAGTDLGKPIFTDERDETIPDHAYDCLSADTQVLTDLGWRAIQEMSNSGVVMTPVGWRTYSDCKMYRKNSEMVKMNLRDGRSVVSTPDHLFLSENGWIEAQDLTGRRVAAKIPEWNPLTQLFFRILSRVFSDLSTTAVARISAAMENFCIALFGNTTMGLCLSGITSTTEMRIGPTIRFPISSVFQSRFTLADILKENRTPKRFELCKQKPNSGIEVREGSLGIGNSIESFSPKLISGTLRKFAFNVERHFSQLAEQAAGQNTAIRIAKLLPSGADVESLKPAEKQDAYCLTVHDPCQSFLINGGIVAHNCVRYFVSSRASVPVQAIARYGKQSFFGRRDALKEWKRRGGLGLLRAQAEREAMRYGT